MLASTINVGSAGREAANSLNMSFLLYMVAYQLVVTKIYQLACHSSLTLVGTCSAQYHFEGEQFPVAPTKTNWLTIKSAEQPLQAMKIFMLC